MMGRLLTISLLSLHVLSINSQVPGDVEVGGLYQIWERTGDQCANTVSESSVQVFEATKWAINYVNRKGYLPGFTIGLQPLTTCRVNGKAVQQTLRFLERARNEKTNSTYSKAPLIGMVGPEYSSEAIDTSQLMSSLPDDDQLLQVPFSATAEVLSNKEMFRNIKRTIPSDLIQAEVIISLMKKLEWNYIAVIYENDAYGTGAFARIRSLADSEGICIPYHSSLSIGTYGEIIPAEINVILKNITQSPESHIQGAVVIGTSNTANFLLSAAQTLRNSLDFRLVFIFSEAVELNSEVFRSDSSVISLSRGSFVVSPPQIQVPGFTSHWRSIFEDQKFLENETLTNPWLERVYRTYHSCDQGGDISSCVPTDSGKQKAIFESTFTGYAIESVLVFAKILKTMHSDLCKNVSGLCVSMKTVLFQSKGRLINVAKNVEIEVSKEFPTLGLNYTLISSDSNNIGRKEGSKYDVYHFKKCANDDFCFEKVGTFVNNNLNLQTSLLRDYSRSSNIGDDPFHWPNLLKAQCADESRCESCLNKNIHNEMYFQEGDLYVVGLVPVFDKAGNGPLNCGNIRAALGVQLAEAMAYAVKLVNEKKGTYSNFFPGKKIGYVIINTCNQPVRAQQLLLSLFNDGLKLTNGSSIPIIDRLLGLVSAYGSSVSLATASVLTNFNLAQVSYASTAAVLSDRDTYPYFLRVATPDDKQAMAMVKIVKDMKESNYIQIIYSEGTYGEGGRDALRSEAKRLKICIANEIKVIEGQYNTLLEDMRKKAYAKVVIVFLRSHVVYSAISTMYPLMDKHEFVFIGSEAWGDRSDIIAGKENLAGSFSLGLKMLQRSEFQDYLNEINILNDAENPWIRQYFETKYTCYLPGSFDRRGRSPCANTRLTSTDYKQELWTPFAMNAMLSLLGGTNDAFSKLCGAQHDSICTDFKTNPGRVYDYIKTQKLPIDDSGGETRIFNDNGDGNVGYRIYQVQKQVQDHTKTEYVQVGRSTLDEDGYKLDKTRVNFEEYGSDVLPSVCPNKRECDLCFKSTDPSSPQSSAANSSSSNIAVIGGMGAAIAILALALIAAIVLIIWKKRQWAGTSNADDYIDPLPEGMREFYEKGQYVGETRGHGLETNGSDDSGIHSHTMAAV